MGQGLTMARLFLVDTDILIDFLRGQKEAIEFIKKNTSRIVLSTIVIAELFAGVRDDEQDYLDEFVSLFPTIPVTSEIAKAGGLYKRDFQKTHRIGLADAIIAATVEIDNFELKTLNIKHYPMFPKLKPTYFKS